MGNIRIRIDGVTGTSSKSLNAQNSVKNVRLSIDGIKSHVDTRIMNRSNLWYDFKNISTNLSAIESKISRIRGVVEYGANVYNKTDSLITTWATDLKGMMYTPAKRVNSTSNWTESSYQKNKDNNEKIENKNSKFDWELDQLVLDGIGSAGIIGSLVSTIGKAATGGTINMNLFDILGSAADFTANTFESVSKPNFDWKLLFGLQPAVDYDDTKDFLDILEANIKEYTFDSSKKLVENPIDPTENKQIVASRASTGAKIGGLLLTIAETGYENFTDDTENNTTTRKVAETVGESAVKVAEGFVVAAGVTAAFAAAGVAAPAVAVGVVTTGVVWIGDKVSEAITGKDLAEFTSDTVLDAATSICDSAVSLFEDASTWWPSAFA